MDKKFLVKVALKFTLAIVVVVMAVYVGTTELNKKVEVIPQKTDTVSSEVENNDQSTSDWQVYRNDELGFELKYHPYWEIAAGDVGVNEGNKHYLIDYFGFNDVDNKNSKNAYPLLQISLFDESKYDGQLLSYGELLESRKINKFDVDIYSDSSYSGYAVSGIINIINSNYLVLRVAHIDKESDALKILEDILQTFRFIDDIDTTDWQTYRNEEYGFVFNYPSDWNLAENESTGPAWEENKKGWRWEEYQGKEVLRSFDDSDRLLHIVEVKDLPLNEYTGCSSGGPGVSPDGIQVEVIVKKALEQNFDDIINQCEKLSEINKCDSRIVDDNDIQMLIIDNKNSSCRYPAAYVLFNDLLYSIEPLWSNSATSNVTKYKASFYSLVDSFRLIDSDNMISDLQDFLRKQEQHGFSEKDYFIIEILDETAESIYASAGNIDTPSGFNFVVEKSNGGFIYKYLGQDAIPCSLVERYGLVSKWGCSEARLKH